MTSLIRHPVINASIDKNEIYNQRKISRLLNNVSILVPLLFKDQMDSLIIKGFCRERERQRDCEIMT